MKMKLKKDIIIHAGTILDVSPRKTERSGDGHYSCSLGLSKDTSGVFEYYIDPLDAEMKEWFEICP